MDQEEKQANLERVAGEVRKLAEPLNLTELETEGVIIKDGDWYRVNSFEALPENASNRIAQLEQDDHGIKVKFLDPTKFEAVVKKLDQHGL